MGAFRVAWYRFRATLARRWGGLLAVVLLIGLLGGLAMGAIIAARRTQSSFPRFLASTHPSQLTATTFTDGTYDRHVVGQISLLPGVQHVESVAGLDIAPLGADGLPDPSSATASGEVLSYGSVDGLYFDQDHVTVIKGRMSLPGRADEVVMTKDAARLLHVSVGDLMRVGVYANSGHGLSRLGAASPEPRYRSTVKVVGLVVFNDAVVRDDAFRFPTYVLFTPAFTRPLTRCCAFYTVSGIQAERRSVDETALETAVERSLPHDSTFYFRTTSIVEAQVERATRPEAVALGVFGAIAAIAALVIVSQVIVRQLNAASDQLLVLRALGASPVMMGADGLIGAIGAVASGALVAAVVAVLLSSLGPIGPIRAVDPGAGTAFDWTVLAIGTVTLIGALSGVAVVDSSRLIRRLARPPRPRETNASVIRAATTAPLPLTATQGIHFALDAGRPRNPFPARSTTLSAALAIGLVVTAVVFGASLNRLVSHPALYGWNWDYELSSRFGGSGNIPQQQAALLLNHDRDIAAWTGVYFDTMRIDDRTVPILGATPGAAVGPPILTGHALQSSDEIVLGANTLAQLHKRLGDLVEVRYATVAKPTPLRIVGTATMPAIGPGGGLHLSMGAGAIVAYPLIPFTVRNGGGTAIGPNAIFVRLRHAERVAAHRGLQSIATTLVSPSNGPVSLLSSQRPAEIVNYRSIGATPAILAAVLVVAAGAVLALTLAATVRGRRRELALLKALGFTRRQLAAVVAWQSTIIVLIGTLIGIPAGILIGRALWNLFATTLHVVPSADIPAPAIALAALGAVLVANIVAALPARQAARTRVAALLHAE